MNAEDELRTLLREGIFSPYNWYSEITGNVVAGPDMILDAVIEFFKERALLIMNGEISRIERAEFDPPDYWLVRVAED